MEVSEKCQTVLFQLPNSSTIYNVLYEIHMFYKPVHAYVSIVLCILGAICNFCNIVVLTRKQMRTPVNMILTAMACCDTIVLFSNLIYTTHYTFVAFDNCVPRNWSYGWALFLISHAHLSLVGHSSSIWLSVMLALIRYITLRHRGKSNSPLIVLRHSYIAIASVFIFVSLTNTPNFLTYKIKSQPLINTCLREQIQNESLYDAPAYVPGISDLALVADCLVFRLAFWISGTIFKLLPCILLTVLVSLLTRILNEVRENRNRLLLGNKAFNSGTYMSAEQSSNQPPQQTTELMTFSVGTVEYLPIKPNQFHETATNHSHLAEQNTLAYVPQKILVTVPPLTTYRTNGSVPCATPLPSPACCRFQQESPKHGRKTLIRGQSFRRRKSEGCAMAAMGRTDRTTRMLLTIVCVFLITELPQGIMAVLSGMFSEEFRYFIYNSMGDILDLLSLCNACTSFVIYCSMSAQFRNEFRRVFFPTQMKCWMQIVSVSADNRRCRLCNALVGSRSVVGARPNKTQKLCRNCCIEGNNDHQTTITLSKDLYDAAKPLNPQNRKEMLNDEVEIVCNGNELSSDSSYYSHEKSAATQENATFTSDENECVDNSKLTSISVNQFNVLSPLNIDIFKKSSRLSLTHQINPSGCRSNSNEKLKQTSVKCQGDKTPAQTKEHRRESTKSLMSKQVSLPTNNNLDFTVEKRNAHYPSIEFEANTPKNGIALKEELYQI